LSDQTRAYPIAGVLLWLDSEWASIFASRVKRDKKVFLGPDKDPFVVRGIIPRTDEQEIAECVLALRTARDKGDQDAVNWRIDRLAILTGLDVSGE